MGRLSFDHDASETSPNAISVSDEMREPTVIGILERARDGFRIYYHSVWKSGRLSRVDSGNFPQKSTRFP
jgi:hypothetical protein